ncbi:MAG: tetratricopeptide repeat protein [Cyanobacteria bacterium HKST-UBA02]|nr:tetratricopeptide repeat protein [Cyanobacteria bacterium HKST-UBA02]
MRILKHRTITIAALLIFQPIFSSAGLAAENAAEENTAVEKSQTEKSSQQVNDLVQILEKAEKAFAEGEYDQARQEYARLKERAPDNILGYLGIGRIDLLQGKNMDALEQLSKAVEIAPHSPDARFELGSTYLALGMLDDAIKHLKIAADISPQRPEIQYKLASARSLLDASSVSPGASAQDTSEAPASPDETSSISIIYRLITSGRLEESVEQAMKAAEAHPDSPNLQYQLGMLYKAQGDINQALVHFENALTLNPQHVLALDQIAMIYLGQNNYVAAEKVLDSWIALDADDPSAQFGKAWCQIMKGDFARAEKHLTRAVQLDPRNVELLNHYGLVLREQGDDGRAMRIFERALDLKPQARSPRLNLAMIYLADDKAMKADNVIDPLRSQQMRRPFFMAVSALCHARLGQLEEAMKESDAAYKLVPDMPVAIVARAEVLSLTKDPQALPLLEQARKRYPRNILVLQELAESYARIGDYQKAEECARESLTLNQDNLKMAELLVEILARQGKVEEAFESASSIKYPDERKVRMLHGRVLVLADKKKEAVAYFKDLVDKDSDDLEAAYRLAELYFEDGKYKDARKCLENILEEDPGRENSRLLLARLLYETRKYKEALGELSHITPDSEAGLATSCIEARCHYRLKQYRQAISGFAACMKNRDLDPEELIMYATALKETGDLDQAKKMLARARDKNPVDRSVRSQIKKLEQDLPAVAENGAR